MEYVIYKSISAVPLTFRVFLNFPRWAGMKVYEIIVEDFNVKIKLLAECKAQLENKKTSELYAEASSFANIQWEKFEDKGTVIRCINCKMKLCNQCKHYNVFTGIA